MPAPVFAVGDVHGHRDVLVGLLRDAGLLDASERWSGAEARLWLLGDLFDRGPDGIGALELVRRLERESTGAVRCLLGNHEALILAARRFGDEDTGFTGQSFLDVWKLNGGLDADLAALTDEQVGWITHLPPLAREGDWLLVHADTDAYLDLGGSIEEVTHETGRALRVGDAARVDTLLGILSDRQRLDEMGAVDALLGTFGGMRIVHGHTPIASVVGAEPRDVTGPFDYGAGRVRNIDHCLFAGGNGFVVRLDEADGGPGPRA
ncbi:MAG: metallophosphoesterase [Actinobacteria bacterium]|nr:metallophosphoesterase [Actinomycetota bacterium]